MQLPVRVPVPSIDGFDLHRLQQAQGGSGTPVVFRGAARSWPAFGLWTPELFAERFGDVEISPAMNLPDAGVPYTFIDQDFRQTMSVREFIQRMGEGSCYLDQFGHPTFDPLKQEYDFRSFGIEHYHVVNLWVGSKTRSGMHYDWVDNIFAQIYGSKRVLMVSKDEMRNMYPFSDSHTKCRVDPENIDLKAFPRFSQVTIWETEVGPGDILFIPRAWWHYLASSDVSISLNCWYGEQRTPAEEFRGTLATRDPRILVACVRDFVRYGVLGREYKRRLFSPPPTGLMLYELVKGLTATQKKPEGA